MKNKLHYLVGFFLFMVPMSTYAQKDISKIIEATDIESLKVFAKSKEEQYNEMVVRAKKILKGTDYDSISIMGITPDGQVLFGEDDNIAAADFSNTDSLHSGGGMGLTLNGTGFQIGQWESSVALNNHVVFSGNRIIVGDATPVSDHATHVAGTLISDGTGSPSASLTKGMAPNASIKSYNHANMISEMATEATNGVLVSNYSSGIRGGYERDDTTATGVQQWEWLGSLANYNAGNDSERFGLYDDICVSWDSLTRLAPMFLIVKSSGNERADDPTIGTDLVRHSSETTYQVYNNAHPLGDALFNNNGYATIRTSANAKNVLVIGNVDGADSLKQNPSSSWGPTDDGRIKPDMVGHGTSLLSSSDSSIVSYKTKSGTSMSTPNVAGSAILLQELYEDEFGSGEFMRSATLKALLIHSATNLDDPGPDYRNGYGMVNAAKAARHIMDASAGDRVSIDEYQLQIGTTPSLEFGYISSCVDTLGLTLVYTDLAGTVETSQNTNVKLINDIDMVVDNGNTLDYPWKLNPNNPAVAATKGDNDLDNVEQIISRPNQSLQTVLIDFEGILTGGQQKFSLISTNYSERCIVSDHVANQDGDPWSGTYNFCNLEELTSSSEINAGAIIKYIAGQRVLLLPGFHAKSGSSTLVSLKESCN